MKGTFIPVSIARSIAWCFSVAALIPLTLLVVADAAAQTWNYKSSTTARGGGRSVYGVGYVTLKENAGKAVVEIAAGSMSICWRGELDATVTKTEATTTIAIPPRLTGCEEIRFVLKNDGTGGQREIKTGADWVADSLDRDLTLRK